MKNAALVLGIIGGIVGMIVGFFVYGYVELVDWLSTQTDETILEQAENPLRLQIIGLVSPLLAIAGGAMANLRPTIAAGLLAIAAGGMFWGLGFGVFTMFPIAMTALAALLALLGRATKEPGSME